MARSWGEVIRANGGRCYPAPATVVMTEEQLRTATPPELRDFLMERSAVDPDHSYNGTCCIVWVFVKSDKGYGLVRFGYPGSLYRVHRLAYERFVRPIPLGLQVLHHCDNPPCWNPDHLWAGTNAQNRADEVRKNRQNRIVPWAGGENNNHAKLTAENVREIRKLIAEGWDDASLGERFGVTRSNIRFIREGVTWKGIS